MQTITFGGSSASTPYDDLFAENLDRRIIVLNSEINDTLIDDIMIFILKWNREDIDIPKKKREKIKLYINSPGGDAFVAGQFCSLIESSETPIIGVAFNMVASAAYHIYIACDERIAFANSTFLQHEGELEVSNSTSKFKNTIDFYESMDERFKQNVINHTHMSEEYYNNVYTNEFWMYADQAKELGVVDKIIGIDCKLDEIL